MGTIREVDGITNVFRLDSIEPVIYFLLAGDEVVYVGQSINWLSRLKTHASDLSGQFDSIAFLPIPIDHLHAEERKWIKHFNPRLNSSHAPHYNRPKRRLTCRASNDHEMQRLVEYLGLSGIAQLADYSADDLLMMCGFGEKSLIYVRDYLAARGLSLK